MEQLSPNGEKAVYNYYNNGLLKEVIEDAEGLARKTGYIYDRLNRQVAITGYGETIHQTTVYGYNEAGLVELITYPDATTLDYAYDNRGLLVDRIDRKLVTTSYIYDDLGALKSKSVTYDPDGDSQNTEFSSRTESVVFTRDGLGRVDTVTKTIDSTQVCYYDYDYYYDSQLQKQVEKVSQTILGETRTTEKVFDQAGSVSQIVYPYASVPDTILDFTTDISGQIDTISKIDSINPTPTEIVDYDYYGRVQRFRDFPVPGITQVREYGDFGRMDRLHDGIVDFEYAYDKNSNITSQRYNHRSLTPSNYYSYDSLNRLTNSNYLVAPYGSDDSDLVGYWPYESTSGSTAYDYSSSGYDGALTNFTGNPWSEYGKIGNALIFDGVDDKIATFGPSTSDLGGSDGELTYSAWVKLDNTKNYNFLNSGMGTRYFSAGHSGGDAYLRACLKEAIAPNLYHGLYNSFTGSGSIQDKWTHVACSLDVNQTGTADSYQFFLDGEASVEQTTDPNLLDLYLDNYGLTTQYVSEVGSTQDYMFSGMMDDFRVYDRKLTEDDIKTLAASHSERFDYDLLGNRLSVKTSDGELEIYAVDPLTNQYDATTGGVNTIECVYDTAGNMTVDHRGYEYFYDYENRLIRIKSGSSVVVDYTYDMFGRRIQRSDSAVYKYYYDG
ncbi:MAG: LamG domain-containing protein, partial [Desulfobacterales bacterium]|nr:LamG domain-containing protein [Desulfobacterales bacterium]